MTADSPCVVGQSCCGGQATSAASQPNMGSSAASSCSAAGRNIIAGIWAQLRQRPTLPQHSVQPRLRGCLLMLKRLRLPHALAEVPHHRERSQSADPPPAAGAVIHQTEVIKVQQKQAGLMAGAGRCNT